MPEYPIMDSVITSLNAQEPWPESVKLFQPYEVEQILLPDQASCLAVQAFLKMCNLPFEVEMRWNAEFMSPSGRVPFIKCGAFVVAELEPIVQFAANKGVSLCSKLATEEKAEMRAYMSLITNVLVNAELYISWVDNDTFNAVTKVRNSSVYPWPLGWLQTRAKRSAVAKRLKALHWHDKTLDQVLADVDQCCNSLSQRLGDKDYFFGTQPTPLDALVYGHVRALLSASGPKAGLFIKPISSALLRHVIRVTSLVGLKLTPQEDYLLTQACHMSYQRRSDRASRSRRSGSASSAGRDQNASRRPGSASSAGRDSAGLDAFGIKPFASKKVLIMTTNDGKLTCHIHGHEGWYCGNDDRYKFITELLEDIIDKVDETAIDKFARGIENQFNVDETVIDKFNLDETVVDKFARSVENEYELLSYPTDRDVESTSKADSMGMDTNEGLDTIEENDMTDFSISIDDGIEDVLHMINDEMAGGEFDSDGVVNDRLLSSSLRLSTFDDDAHNSEMSKSLPASSTPEVDLRPTELDALVFGHVFTILTTRLPSRRLADTVRKHAALVAHAQRVDEQYFRRP